MANTKIPAELSSTPSISDSGDATAITIDSSENIVVGGTTAYGRLNLHGTGSTTASLTGIKESSFTSYDDNGGSAGSISGFFNFKATTGIGGGMGIIRESASDWGSAVGFYTHPTTTSNIGDLTERMRINSSGNVGIGTTTITSSTGWSPKLVLSDTSAALILKGVNSQEANVGVSNGLYLDALGSTTASYNQILFRTSNTNSNFSAVIRMAISSNGSIGTSAGGSQIASGSDRRLKQNINSLSDSLNIVNNLNPVSFNWVDNFSESEKDKTLYGFVAQEVQHVFPDAVEDFGGGDDIELNGKTIENPLTVREKFLVPVLVKAMQEQQNIIDDLKARIETLEA